MCWGWPLRTEVLTEFGDKRTWDEAFWWLLWLRTLHWIAIGFTTLDCNWIYHIGPTVGPSCWTLYRTPQDQHCIGPSFRTTNPLFSLELFHWWEGVVRTPKKQNGVECSSVIPYRWHCMPDQIGPLVDVTTLTGFPTAFNLSYPTWQDYNLVSGTHTLSQWC